MGSPPPMRGKASPSTIRRQILRITPAYAGKSVQRSKYFNSIRDHPRLCGEKFEPLQKGYTMTGSPPPMRGKGANDRTAGVGTGITPAYAGKSLRHSDCWCKVYGSPPPMRGKGIPRHDILFLHGITPAYAGKRLWRLVEAGSARDHPRLCGEKHWI